MTKTLFGALGATLGAAALYAVTATAVTLTLSDPNCSDFSLGGSPGARTLSCVVNTPPACTVTGPSTGTVNIPITLTASCSPAATSWSWTGGNCAGMTTATCGANSASAGPVIYTVTGTNSSGSGTSPNFTVTWSATPPPPPSGCTLTANPSSMASAGNVLFTAACSGGGAPTSYAWTGPGIGTPTATGTQTINVAATATFTVTPSNSGGNGNTPSVTVTVGGGGGGVPASCVFRGVTYPVLDLDAQAGITTLPLNNGATVSSGFTGSKMLIATLIPPAGWPTSTNTLAVFEWGGAPIDRLAWLSKTPCDTSAATFPYYQSSTGPVFNYSIGGADPNAVNMAVGEKWYLMVLNQRPFFLGNSCTGGGNCDVGVKWYQPH